jgi:hypothetical protein
MSTVSRSVLLVCGLLMTFAASAQDPARDDFERVSLGGNWTRFSGSDAEIVNGSDLGKPTNAWLFVGWTASEFAADQFCEAVIADGRPVSLLTQVYARRRTNDLARYGFHFNDENEDGTGIANPRWEIKYDGVPTAQTRILASILATMPQPGDTLRIEVRGTSLVNIKGFHNGVEVISAMDSAHQRITTSGVVGMVSRLRRGGYTAPPNSPVFASWRGGSLGPELRIQPGNAGGPDFVVQFNTSTNKTYTVERSETLNSPEWTTLSTVGGDGAARNRWRLRIPPRSSFIGCG